MTAYVLLLKLREPVLFSITKSDGKLPKLSNIMVENARVLYKFILAHIFLQ